MEKVRAFKYRLARQVAGFRVVFSTEARTAIGHCRNFSPSGVEARFDVRLEEGSSGLLILHHPAGVLEVEAAVTRVSEEDAGLEFRCETSEQRNRLAELLGTQEVEIASSFASYPSGARRT